MSEAAQTIQLPSLESAIALSGVKEENLKFLSQHTGTSVVLRGQDVLVRGREKAVDRCVQALYFLQPFWETAQHISQPDLLTAFHAIDTHQVEEYQDLQKQTLGKTRRGEYIRAKTFRQRQYIQLIQKHDITFGIGPAGTGKTFLAAVLAVQALLRDEVERLILTRPAVEAGEKLGFLPGDLQQKVDPFLRPLYDALYQFIDPLKLPELMEKGRIEIAPLAYMRGRTLSNSFVIVDEAQNTTPAQLKMVLTRLGFGSKMVITGDITQTDLPSHQSSGLVMASKILKSVDGIGFCYLTDADVVRHPLVQKIVSAYDRFEQHKTTHPNPKRSPTNQA